MISPQVPVAVLLDAFPSMASLLLELRLGCLGCTMNKFCTLEELCIQYDLDLDSFLITVQQRINIQSD